MQKNDKIQQPFIILKLSKLGIGLPRWHSSKEFACQCRRHKRCGLDPWVRRSPGEGNGNPLQSSFLENSMHREVWQAPVHKVTESQTHTQTHTE